MPIQPRTLNNVIYFPPKLLIFWAAIKSGTLNIKLSTFTAYKAIVDPDTNTIVRLPDKVEVKVNVTSQGVEDTVYKQSHLENTENVPVRIEGVGNVTVKVYVAEKKEKTQICNLNQEDTTFEISK